MRELELDLDVYQGPFDLLLSLVLKEEIDLLEVPLLEVILAYLEQMEETGTSGYWDEMTEFLLLMSLLVEVKSRMLLPGLPLDGAPELTPEEAREQFLARLFAYGKFKAAAGQLRGAAETAAASFLRAPVAEQRRRLPPLDEIAGTCEVLDLKEHLKRLIERRREPDSRHIAQIKVELQHQIRIIRGVLSRHGRLSFNSVFGGEEPLVQALSLFALLELLSREEVRISQPRLFGDIVVKVTDAPKTA